MLNVFSIEMMKPLFDFIERLEGVQQSPIHHPEGNVLTHTVQVTNYAFRETIDTDLILAAMLHDIGKFENSKGHEQIAVEWLEPYCSVKTLWLIQHHMRIWYYLKGEMKRLAKCKELTEHPWLPELIQLARWDNAGRICVKKLVFDRNAIVERLNKAVQLKFTKAVENGIKKD